MGDFFKLVAEVGFPIAAAISAGYFVFLTLKFILAGVTSSVNGIKGIIRVSPGQVKHNESAHLPESEPQTERHLKACSFFSY